MSWPTAPLDRRARIRGLLLGCAVGDAFGSAIEHGASLHAPDPQTVFGRDPALVAGPLPDAERWAAGRISSDTQQLLAGCDGIIRCIVRSFARSHAASLPALLERALIRWHLAVLRPAALAWVDSGYPGWLVSQDAVRDRRSPAQTAHEALARTSQDQHIYLGRPAVNDSRGAGTLARSLAVGLARGPGEPATDDRRLAGIAAKFARTTHGHPVAAAASAALAVLAAHLLDGSPLGEALRAARAALADMDGAADVLAALDRAQTAEQWPQSHAGATADHVLGRALHATVRGGDLPAVLRSAAGHRASPGIASAVAGALAGAAGGHDAIPGDWLAGLEVRGLVEQVADDLQAPLAIVRTLDQTAPPGLRERTLALAGRYPGV